MLSAANSLVTRVKPQSSSQWQKHSTWHKGAFACGVLLLAMLTETNTGYMDVAFLAGLSAYLQMVMFIAGIVLLIWGAGGGFQRKYSLTMRHELVLIVLLAFLLRVIASGETVRVLVDELNTLAGILFLRENPNGNILWSMTSQIMPYPWHYVVPHHLAVELFGRNLAALRLADAFIGTASIAALYLLARTLFNRLTATIAALLLITFPLHLHLSRLALINLTDALLIPLVLAFLLRGLRDNQRIDFVLAGTMLGLTQYFYEGGRLLSIPLVFMIIVAGFIGWRNWLRGRARGLFWLLFMFGLMCAPLLITWSATSAHFAGRLTSTTLGTDYWRNVLLSPVDAGWLEILLGQVSKAFLVYIDLPDQTIFFGGNTAMILPVLLPFFLLGIGYVLRHWRSPAIALFLWILAISLGNGLFMPNPARYARFIGVTPALVLVIALGLGYSLMVSQRLSPRIRQWQKPIAIGLACLLMFIQGRYYFASHLPAYNNQFRLERPYPDVDDAMLRAATLPPGTQVHLIMPDGMNRTYAHTFLRFLADDVTATTWYTSEITDEWSAGLSTDIDQAFFLMPDDARSLHIIRQYVQLDEGFSSPYTDLPATTTMILYRVEIPER